jgi:hypothetical protein
MSHCRGDPVLPNPKRWRPGAYTDDGGYCRTTTATNQPPVGVTYRPADDDEVVPHLPLAPAVRYWCQDQTAPFMGFAGHTFKLRRQTPYPDDPSPGTDADTRALPVVPVVGAPIKTLGAPLYTTPGAEIVGKVGYAIMGSGADAVGHSVCMISGAATRPSQPNPYNHHRVLAEVISQSLVGTPMATRTAPYRMWRTIRVVPLCATAPCVHLTELGGTFVAVPIDVNELVRIIHLSVDLTTNTTYAAVEGVGHRNVFFTRIKYDELTPYTEWTEDDEEEEPPHFSPNPAAPPPSSSSRGSRAAARKWARLDDTVPLRVGDLARLNARIPGIPSSGCTRPDSNACVIRPRQVTDTVAIEVWTRADSRNPWQAHTLLINAVFKRLKYIATSVEFGGDLERPSPVQLAWTSSGGGASLTRTGKVLATLTIDGMLAVPRDVDWVGRCASPWTRIDPNVRISVPNWHTIRFDATPRHPHVDFVRPLFQLATTAAETPVRPIVIPRKWHFPSSVVRPSGSCNGVRNYCITVSDTLLKCVRTLEAIATGELGWPEQHLPQLPVELWSLIVGMLRWDDFHLPTKTPLGGTWTHEQLMAECQHLPADDLHKLLTTAQIIPAVRPHM